MSLRAALDRLAVYVRAVASEWGTPGLAVAVTDRERTLGVVSHGYADLAERLPVTPAMLFQIGSISKSFAALAVMREVEAGRLSLPAPVTDYLSWLPLRTAGEPVTLHHLLSHTSGLPAGMEATPSTIGEALRVAAHQLQASTSLQATHDGLARVSIRRARMPVHGAGGVIVSTSPSSVSPRSSASMRSAPAASRP
jgi:CubicO group peptidase (beta-lactamase class C family)